MSAKKKVKYLQRSVEYGTLYAGPADYPDKKFHGPLFLRQHVGTASDDKGNNYEMESNMGDHSPMVKSVKTGRVFLITWEHLLGLAKAAGIDSDVVEWKEAE